MSHDDVKDQGSPQSQPFLEQSGPRTEVSMSQSAIAGDSTTNHREHETLRLEVESLRAALDSLAAYSEAIANLRSLREVAEHLRSLLSDIPAHFVHEERTVLGHHGDSRSGRSSLCGTHAPAAPDAERRPGEILSRC